MWGTWNTSGHATSFVPVTALGPSLPQPPSHGNVKPQVRGASPGSYFLPLPGSLPKKLNSAKPHLIVAHGCSLNSYFTLPAGTRLVYLVPPACDMQASSQTALMRTPGVLDKVLDYGGPSSVRVRDTTYTVQRYGYGARVLDQVLTFSHDTGYAGVFALPLHLDVTAGGFGAATASASARIVAEAKRHELTGLNYLRNPDAFLSEYLALLGPGTYVIAACRGLCTNSVTTGAERSLGRRSPFAVERNAWSSSVLNSGGVLPDTRTGLIRHTPTRPSARPSARPRARPRDTFRVLPNVSGSNRSNGSNGDVSNSERRLSRRRRLVSPGSSNANTNTSVDVNEALWRYGDEERRKRVLARRPAAPEHRRALGELQTYFRRGP